MEPLKQWICDECRNIVMADDGSFLWNRDYPGGGPTPEFPPSFIIVHKKCDTNDRTRPQQLPIDFLLGPQGLLRLTQMLPAGPSQQGRSAYLPNPDFDSYVDLCRLLHVPYYEEARRYFSTHTASQLFGSQSRVLSSDKWQESIAEAKTEIHPALVEGMLS